MKEFLNPWRRYLAEQVEMSDASNPTVAAAGKEKEIISPKTRGEYVVANFFMYLSNAVRNSTGIRILDPTASKTPPAWATTNPKVWASLQTIADLLADDPFSVALLFFPVGRLGTKGVQVLESAGMRNLASKAATPVGELIIQNSPKNVSQIINSLRNTEVKATAQEYFANLSKAQLANKNPLVVQALSGYDPAQVLAYSKAARQTIAKVASGSLSSYARVVSESIVDKQFFIIMSEDAVRPVVILETQQGKIAFYRSSGQSTPGVKLEGEWHIFGGLKPSSTNHTIYMKNKYSVNLANGGDEYLTKISLALEEAWNSQIIARTARRINLKDVAKANWERINSHIESLNKEAGFNKYHYYNMDTLQEAYMNFYLNQAGALSDNSIAKIINNSDEFVGLANIRSEKLTQMKVPNKILPAIFQIGH